jgi:hypothetical protein
MKSYDIGPVALLPFWTKSCYGFLSPVAIQHSWPGLNLWTLGVMASTITITPLRMTSTLVPGISSCFTVSTLAVCRGFLVLPSFCTIHTNWNKTNEFHTTGSASRLNVSSVFFTDPVMLCCIIWASDIVIKINPKWNKTRVIFSIKIR